MEEIKKIIKHINSEKIDKEDYYTLKESLNSLELKYLSNNLYSIFNHLEKKDDDEIKVIQENKVILSIKHSDINKINIKENEFRSNLITEDEFINEIKSKIQHKINEENIQINEEISFCRFNDINSFLGDVIEINYHTNVIHCLYCYLHFNECGNLKNNENMVILNGVHTLLGKVIINLDQLNLDDLLQNFIQQNKFLYLKENFNKFLYSEENLTKLNEILELRYFLAKENNCSLDLVMTDLQILHLLEKKDILSLDRLSSVVRGNFADFSFLFKNENKEKDVEILDEPTIINNFSKKVNCSTDEKEESVNKLTFSNKKIKKKKKESEENKNKIVRKKESIKNSIKSKVSKKSLTNKKEENKSKKSKEKILKNNEKKVTSNIKDNLEKNKKTNFNNKTKDNQINEQKNNTLKNINNTLKNNKKRKVNDNNKEDEKLKNKNTSSQQNEVSLKKETFNNKEKVEEIKEKVKKINLKTKRNKNK